MDVWPWLEWVSRELDVEGWGGVRFDVRVQDPRPRTERSTMRDWYRSEPPLQARMGPTVVSASLADYVQYVARANGWVVQVTDEAVVVRDPKQTTDTDPNQ